MFKSKTNIILTIILLFLLVTGGFFAYKVLNPPIKAVNYEKMTAAEATAWFKENEIEDKCEIKQDYDDTVPEGQLIFQSIKEGTDIKEKVTLVYSKGKDPDSVISIPDLQTLDESKKWFEENGFSNVEYIYSGGDKEEGTVLSIDPKEASRKDKITIAVSGTESYEVPAFANKAEIEEWIKDKNIKVTYINEFSSLEEGKVIKQEPELVKNGGTLTITIASKSTKVNLPTNLLGISESDFLAKCKELGLTNVVKDNKGYYTTKTNVGKLAYYLPDGYINKDNKVIYRLSLGGYKFDASEYNGLTKEKAIEYIKELNNRNAQINPEIDLVDKETTDRTVGTLFGCEDISNTNKVQVSCFIAKGDVSSSDNADDVYLPTNLLGVSETEFLEKTKSLGLTNLTKDESGYYSTINPKGTIAYYDPDGDMKTNTKVTYKLSLGAYEFSENEYNGKTKSELDKYIKELSDKNAKVVLNTTDKESDKPSGTAFNCTASKEGITVKVSCNISKNIGQTSSKVTLPSNLLGKTEADFLSKCKELGFNNVVKDESGYYSTVNPKNTIAYYDPDGLLDISTKIVYKLSMGSYEFNSANYNGKTKEEAENYAAGLNNLNAHILLNITDTKTSSYNEGILFDCSSVKSGVDTNVSCKRAIKEEEKKATILNADKLISYYSTSTYEETAEKIKKYFSSAGFTNVSITGKESKKSVGQILNISVNGDNSYKQGEYPFSSQIVIEISNKLIN